MAIADAPGDTSVVFDRQRFEAFVADLLEADYRVVAPILKGEILDYGEISSPSDIPRGIVVDKAPGLYAIRRTGSNRFFDHTVGPDSAKRWLFPPEQSVWTGTRVGRTMTVAIDDGVVPKLALIGLRPCDLRSIRILDRVMLDGPYRDRQYAARREATLLVGVNCSTPAPTCFCESMGSGPTAVDGYDLLLTETDDGFVIEVGSDKGRQVLEKVSGLRPTVGLRDAGREVPAVESKVDRTELKQMLYRRAESPRWKETASRCLACGNCTMVCPTCFCTTIEDHNALDGSECARSRHWDSCFNVAFSYIHGGSVRQSAASRYRQWLTHKFAAWEDQFGMPGCVGCGRCIVWCPAGIDVTEELAALREEDDKSTTR